MGSLTEKLIAKKKEEETAKTNPPIGGQETGIQSSVEQADKSNETDKEQVADDSISSGSTLANAGVVYSGEPGTVMGEAHRQLEEGLALNKISDEDNEKAIKAYEGELRRQRMLEGRPREDDLKAAQEAIEPPAGGYKSNSILKFANSQGNWVHAVDGYFVPQTEEEFNMLEHYVKTGVVDAPVK